MKKLKKIILFAVLLITLTGCAKQEIIPFEEPSSEINPAPDAEILGPFPEKNPDVIKELDKFTERIPDEGLKEEQAVMAEEPKSEPKPVEEPAAESKDTIFIEIKEFEFVPSTLTIKKGTTVVWNNVDDDAHIFKQVGKSFISPVIKSGETFEHIFNEKEVVKYTDLNYGTRGEIVVE